MGWCEKGGPAEDTAQVVEARGRDIAWICHPATRLVPAPKGGEMGICEACGIPEDAEEERP